MTFNKNIKKNFKTFLYSHCGLLLLSDFSQIFRGGESPLIPPCGRPWYIQPQIPEQVYILMEIFFA